MELIQNAFVRICWDVFLDFLLYLGPIFIGILVVALVTAHEEKTGCDFRHGNWIKVGLLLVVCLGTFLFSRNGSLPIMHILVLLGGMILGSIAGTMLGHAQKMHRLRHS